MLVLLTVVHLVASQLIKAQRSKGEILLFRKQHASKHWLAGGRGGDRESKVPNIFTHEVGGQTNISGENYDQDPIAGTPTSFVHDASAETVLRQTAVFHWNNLNYTIKTRDGHRQILKDINGWVKPVTLTVLMVSKSPHPFGESFSLICGDRGSLVLAKHLFWMFWPTGPGVVSFPDMSTSTGTNEMLVSVGALDTRSRRIFISQQRLSVKLSSLVRC